MIKEDYVSFETAKLLKEKGFPQEYDMFHSLIYNEEDYEYEYEVSRMVTQTQTIKAGTLLSYPAGVPEPKCYCPTLQMAMKWLREVHSCYIVTYWEFKNYDENGNPVFKDIIWSYNIAIPKYNSARKGNGDYFDIESEKEDYTTYEEVCEAAITYCLENLI